MTNDNGQELPPEDDNGSLLVPVILGIGLGAAVLMSQGKKPPGGGGKQPFGLHGAWICDTANQRSQIQLTWDAQPGFTDYDVLIDNHVVDTVRGTHYNSLFYMKPEFGQTHSYQVIAVTKQGTRTVETDTVSAVAQGKVPDCTGTGGSQPSVLGITAEFS